MGLSQNDPQWKLKRINGTNSTIGSYGCLITSLCFILQKAGYNVTPDQLALQSSLFTGDLWNGWDKLQELYPNMSFVWEEKCSAVPAPVDKIMSEVKDGYFPIIMLDYAPTVKGLQTHYLVVIDTDGEGNLKVMDPWDGAEIWLDTRYGNVDEKYKVLKVNTYHFTKPEIVDDAWENIKKFLQEKTATEGDVRAAFGALSDQESYLRKLSDLTSQLTDKNNTILTKDGIISDLNTKIEGLTATLTTKNGYREKLSIILGCENDWDTIVGQVTEAIANEDKYNSLIPQYKLLQGTFEEKVKEEVDKQNYDINLKLVKANTDIVTQSNTINSLTKKVEDLKSIINGTKVSLIQTIKNFLKIK